MTAFGLILVMATLGAPPPDYVGAEACGSCHEAAYRAWSLGPHARALSGLTPAQADDPACRTCHTSNVRLAGATETLPGVQCEACHGGGRRYAPDHVMRDPVLARKLGLEDVGAETCTTCHRPSTPSSVPFDYLEAVQRVCVNRLPVGAPTSQP